MSAATAHDLRGLLLMGLLCAASLALAEALRQLGRVDAESTRKLVHVFVGLIVAAFPLVFQAFWPVAVLCAGFAALLEWGRREHRLLSVHGVARPSLGAAYYPAAVALVFFLAHERPWIYLPSILVMTISDTAAALVGRACGRHVYRVAAGTKSLEGSAAFFVSALPCVYIPLRLTAPLTGLECALAALDTAVLAATLEAVSGDGSDNLSVPVGTCFALTMLVAAPPFAVVLGWVASMTLAWLVWAASDGSRRGRIAPAFGQGRR